MLEDAVKQLNSDTVSGFYVKILKGSRTLEVSHITKLKTRFNKTFSGNRIKLYGSPSKLLSQFFIEPESALHDIMTIFYNTDEPVLATDLSKYLKAFLLHEMVIHEPENGSVFSVQYNNSSILFIAVSDQQFDVRRNTHFLRSYMESRIEQVSMNPTKHFLLSATHIFIDGHSTQTFLQSSRLNALQISRCVRSLAKYMPNNQHDYFCNYFLGNSVLFSYVRLYIPMNFTDELKFNMKALRIRPGELWRLPSKMRTRMNSITLGQLNGIEASSQKMQNVDSNRFSQSPLIINPLCVAEVGAIIGKNRVTFTASYAYLYNIFVYKFSRLHFSSISIAEFMSKAFRVSPAVRIMRNSALDHGGRALICLLDTSNSVFGGTTMSIERRST